MYGPTNFIVVRKYILPVAWVLGSALVLYGSTLGDPYLASQGVDSAERHAPGLVAASEIFITVECVVVAAILRPKSYAKSWGRALVAALLLSLLHWFFFMPLHQPPVFGVHAMWLFVMAATCWLLFIVSGISAAAKFVANRTSPGRPREK